MQRNCSRPVDDRSLAENRRGNIVVLSAFLLVMVFAFTAFAVDMGYITLSKAELQKSADGAALGGIVELYDGWGKGATLTADEAEAAAKAASTAVASANRAGGLPSVYVESGRDVRLGQYQWDPNSGTWSKSWGTSPYNLVEVTVHRDQQGSINGDRPLDLFFGPVIGSRTAGTHAVAQAAMLPGVGIKKIPGMDLGILPITLDVDTWENYVNLNIGEGDSYAWDDATKTVASGSDGIKEINIYPTGSAELPPGNRGTVDFGSENNSTADISRQILYGLNDDDLAAMGGEIDFDNLPLILNGDTGLSAGIKDELEAIKGKPRLIPLFSDVSGPGNNAYYTIVKFAPIRIVYVKLTGSPSSKKVLVQIAPFYSPAVVTGNAVITSDTIFGPASLIQ